MSNHASRETTLGRWSLRALATLGLLQVVFGLSLGAAHYSADMLPFFFVPVIFGLSSIALFATQPQFASVFALIGSIPAVTLAAKANMAMPSLWLLLAPTLWLIALEHPARLPQPSRRFAWIAVVLSSVPTLALLVETSPETNIWWQSWAAALLAALVFISFRCIVEGLHRSPRTLLTIAGLGPLALLFVLMLFGVVDGSSPATGTILAVVCSFAPLGALLNEAANRILKSQEPSSHERKEQTS